MEPPHRNGQLVRDALDRFEAPLCRYAAGLLRDADRARDAVQDTFLRLVWTPPPEEVVRSEPRFRGWLYTVCRNRAMDLRRKEQRMTALADTVAQTRPDPSPEPPERAEAADSHAAVLRAMERLPEHQRECLRLKFAGGLSYREIAEVTGLKEGHVGYLIHHGLKALRESLAV